MKRIEEPKISLLLFSLSTRVDLEKVCSASTHEGESPVGLAKPLHRQHDRFSGCQCPPTDAYHERERPSS